MEDEGKTPTQLSEELATLRQRVAEFQTLAAEQQRVEEALRQSEERYRSLVESSRDAIYTLSSEGLITSERILATFSTTRSSSLQNWEESLSVLRDKETRWSSWQWRTPDQGWQRKRSLPSLRNIAKPPAPASKKARGLGFLL
jgi:PAS domain-containing protein